MLHGNDYIPFCAFINIEEAKNKHYKTEGIIITIARKAGESPYFSAISKARVVLISDYIRRESITAEKIRAGDFPFLGKIGVRYG